MKRGPLAGISGWFQTLFTNWEQFWFQPCSCEHLAVMRWLVGGMLIYTHFVWGLQLEEFFGSTGWMSQAALSSLTEDSTAVSLWSFVADDQLRMAHTICLVILVAYMIGLATPVTSVLAFAITISNSNRALIANYGLDQILALQTLYLAIGGCGGAYSVDQVLRRLWRNESAFHAPRKTSRARLGTRLIQVHYAVIYFAAGCSKMLGEAWWNGEAMWMAIANAEYQSIDMTWLANYPWILEFATHLTILFEISFLFLIWNQWFRPLYLLLGIGMHLGIALCMGMPTFGIAMIYGYLAFVRPQKIRQIERFFVRLVSPSSARYEFTGGSDVYKAATHRLLLLELEQTGKHVAMTIDINRLRRLGFDVQKATSVVEFEAKLMDGAYASSLVSLELLPRHEAAQVLTMIERLSVHRVACVMLVKVSQIDLLDKLMLSPTVRVLVIPYQQNDLHEQISWSMHHAEQPLNHLLDSDPGGFMMPVPKE
ncbi:hypothetical protein [Lacunimicrobium album]